MFKNVFVRSDGFNVKGGLEQNLKGAALLHLSSGEAALTFLWGLLRHNMAPSRELLHSIFEEDCIYCIF